MSRPSSGMVLYIGENSGFTPMLQDLLSTNPRQRLLQLVPPGFFARALALLTLGSGCMVVLLFHLISLPEFTTPLRLWMLYALILLTANGYLLLVYPVRESFAYPARQSHPVLLVLVVLAYGVDFLLLRSSLAHGASPWLMAFSALLPACSASGLSWWRALLLVAAGSLLVTLALATAVGTHFFLLVLLTQLVVLILFKSVIEEFHQRTILNLSLAELHATQRLLKQSVEQATRHQVARDLHDELGHLLTRLHLNLQRYQTQLNTPDPLLQESSDLLQQLQQEVRTITRQLRQQPTFQLKSALQTLAAAITKPRVQLQLENLEAECPAVIGEVLFRICQEAITNCLRHSNASRIQLHIVHRHNHYQLDIQDNGTIGTVTTASTPGSGLTGLRERVEALGGNFHSEPSSEGFRIQASLPESHHALLPAID